MTREPTPLESMEMESERATLQHAYATALSGPEAQIVLGDLAVFCRELSTAAADRGTDGRIDPLALAFEEGKRAVWLRIRTYLTMDPAEIANSFRRLREAVRGQYANQLDMTRNDR